MTRALLLLLSLLAGGTNFGQCTADQVHEQWNGGTSERNLPGYYEWQSFTAGLDGDLCQVDLLFCNINVPVVGTGTLNVYAGEGIAGTLLATQPVLVDGSALPANQPCWQNWVLANTPTLSAGQLYTLQFVPTAGGGLPDPYLIQIQLPGTYAGGHNYNLGEQGDCAFRTHVSAGSVGVSEVQEPLLQVYPNPVHEHLTVELPATANVAIQVLDGAGRLVLQTITRARRTNLDLSHLNRGTYVVRAITHTAVEMAHVVKL